MCVLLVNMWTCVLCKVISTLGIDGTCILHNFMRLVLWLISEEICLPAGYNLVANLSGSPFLYVNTTSH